MSVPGNSDHVWRAISAAIGTATGENFAIERICPLSGGCINATAIIDSGKQSYFVKLNSAHFGQMFEAEADGLRELATANALRVPLPICHGRHDDHAWLVLENLGRVASTANSDWGQLGRRLALMHRCHQPLYGWHRDNTIGSTEQINTRSESWIAFLRDHRLAFQLNLAARNGHGGRLQSRGSQLLDKLQYFFADYTPEVSLLHGDLWSGNVGFLSSGEAAVFDPAVYYGDRETDVAMTELFGGFGPDFYRAYETAWPLDKGYKLRKQLYNLYHLLNHLNLFGQGYLSSCESSVERLLADVR